MTTFKDVIKKINNEGGSAFLVGGSVLDKLRNTTPKDIDVEVFGVTYQTLLKCLKGFGKPTPVGKVFGVITTSEQGVDYDFSLPRKENRIGVKHTDFEVAFDPDMTIMQAAKRRDLTINSMSWDLQLDRLVDPFGGLADFSSGILKATCETTFIEDPLRVLRVMQFLARDKGQIVSTELEILCGSMVDEFSSLSNERVFEEFNKMLLKGMSIPRGLKFLRTVGWLKHFPILNDMINVEQDPDHHPEGDVWTHTLLVMWNAAELRELIPEDWKLAFMYAALLHDVGKPETTVLKNGKLIAYGHECVGEVLAVKFMKSLTADRDLIRKVKSLVRTHMRPRLLLNGNAGSSAWRRLYNETHLDVLGWLSKADGCGRGPTKRGLDKEDVSQIACHKYFVKLEKTANDKHKIKPILDGKFLIKRGWEPSPKFSSVLKKAYSLQIDYNIKSKWLLFFLSRRE